MAQNNSYETQEYEEDRIITMDDVLDSGSKKATEILQQCKFQYTSSLELVQTKRAIFRERFKLLNNQRKQRDKIGITTMYYMIMILLSVYYIDEMIVGFSGRTFGDLRKADILNNLAKFDWDEMDMDTIEYQKQFDRLFYGVGITAINGWDMNRQCPKPQSMDPLSWLPDPSASKNSDPDTYRWHGFELERSMLEMEKNEAFFNISKIKDDEEMSSEIRQNEQERREAQGLGQEQQKNNDQNEDSVKKLPVIDWFMTYAGKKYLITTANQNGIIIRIEYLEPVLDEEKNEECLVPFPLSLNHYSPVRGDPFGMNMGDFTEDKQRAESVLANLAIAKEKATLYPTYLYDKNKIRNRQELQFGFNKWIGVDGQTTGSAEVLRKDINQQSTFNVRQDLRNEANLAVGASEIQAGVVSSERRTLGEIQNVQSNANLRYALGSKINSWGEKRFWFLWTRSYREYFGSAEKKIIRINSGWGDRAIVIRGKDFFTKEDPSIRIVSKLTREQERDKERTGFLQVAPLILQDPSTPVVARNFIKRHILRLNGIDHEKIRIMVPPSIDEMIGEKNNELLSRNMKVPIRMEEDHLSMIIIALEAEDTPAKWGYIAKHEEAYTLSGQRDRQNNLLAQMAGGSTMNAAGNIAQAQVGAEMTRNSANQNQGSKQPALQEA